ncbi:cellulose synthase 5 [Perilla frutescens var. frutescens]|nr:cellulose synthase 5 [Perilla frutescens var. frutescens]
MEAGRGLVVGSHNRNELVVISSHGDFSFSWEKASHEVCGICGDDVGFTEDGELFVACNECAFPICRACYEYERREASQLCPQCKTRFKRLKGCARVAGDEEEDDVDDLHNEFAFTEPQPETPPPQQHALVAIGTKPTQPLPLVEPKSLEPSEDLAAYGYGRIAWKKRLEKWKSRQESLHRMKLEKGGKDIDDGIGIGSEGPDPSLVDEGCRLPLSRKMPIPASQLNPYRMIVIIRFVVIGFFFHYRILHPVTDAYALWLVSVICEIWFAISWILDQFPKWIPVNRETYLDRLSLRYENSKEGQYSSELPSVDIFVIDKVSCYISDEGASILTFEALSETCEFARKWVPFCKKFNIEPRAPESYFAEKMDYLKDKVFPEFIKERRAIKVPDEGWKMQDGTPWPGNNGRDHPGMIQVFQGQSSINGKDLPCLVYVSREKKPGFDDHKKAGAMNALVRVSAVMTNAPYILNLDSNHYINNSKALREAMCFMMDPLTGEKVCYVQFPQMVDTHHVYANRNTVFFEINMKCLDGIQGPICMGSGCVFRRYAFYGYGAPKSKRLSSLRTCSCWPHHWYYLSSRKKEKLQISTTEGSEATGLKSERLENKFGQSPVFIASTLVEYDRGGTIEISAGPTSLMLSEAIHVIGCGYEEKTEWGKEVGWMYGSITEDVLTGFNMHCRGWRSIYCVPPRPAFRCWDSNDDDDHAHEVVRGAFGSVQIFLSRHCPIWYGYGCGCGLKWPERLFYVNATLYPFASIPLLAYCTLPAVCLLTDKFITPDVDINVAAILFLSLFICAFATCLLEMRWSGVGFGEWWRNQQWWVVGGVSAHLLAVFQGLLNVVAGIEEDNNKVMIAVVAVPPTTLLILNLIGVVAGISNAFSSATYGGPLLGRLLFAFWVIAHLYPFPFLKAKGFRMPTIILLWSILLASIFSFLWIRIHPFLPNPDVPLLQECGIDCN